MENKDLPAFPLFLPENDAQGYKETIHNGLSKLELFTAIALNGILSSIQYSGLGHNESDQISEDAIYIAIQTLNKLNQKN